MLLQVAVLLLVVVTGHGSVCCALTTAEHAEHPAGVEVMMVPMAERKANMDFLYMGGTLGAAVGAENCTLQPSMGFLGLITNHADGSWVFNTSVPWYFAEPCPGCIPMPSHNTSENYVWLDFRVTGHKVRGQMTVGSGGDDSGDAMGIPLSHCSRIEVPTQYNPSREKQVTIAFDMVDFHPGAPPPNCDEDACTKSEEATLWGRLALYARPVPPKPTFGN